MNISLKCVNVLFVLLIVQTVANAIEEEIVLFEDNSHFHFPSNDNGNIDASYNRNSAKGLHHSIENNSDNSKESTYESTELKIVLVGNEVIRKKQFSNYDFMQHEEEEGFFVVGGVGRVTTSYSISTSLPSSATTTLDRSTTTTTSTVSTHINTARCGDQFITYFAEDEAGNYATATRTITILPINRCKLPKGNKHRHKCHDKARCEQVACDVYNCFCRIEDGYAELTTNHSATKLRYFKGATNTVTIAETRIDENDNVNKLPHVCVDVEPPTIHLSSPQIIERTRMCNQIHLSRSAVEPFDNIQVTDNDDPSPTLEFSYIKINDSSYLHYYSAADASNNVATLKVKVDIVDINEIEATKSECAIIDNTAAVRQRLKKIEETFERRMKAMEDSNRNMAAELHRNFQSLLLFSTALLSLLIFSTSLLLAKLLHFI